MAKNKKPANIKTTSGAVTARPVAKPAALEAVVGKPPVVKKKPTPPPTTRKNKTNPSAVAISRAIKDLQAVVARTSRGPRGRAAQKRVSEIVFDLVNVIT